MHCDHEPTPNPSREGNSQGADDSLLPSWEGSGAGRFMESPHAILCAHWDHEQGRGNSGAAVPAVVAGVSPATNPGARRPGGRRDACPIRRSMEKSKEEVVVREPKQRKHDAHERNHMKKITLFALLGTGLLISGCFPT